jgi:hypothetical protein
MDEVSGLKFGMPFSMPFRLRYGCIVLRFVEPISLYSSLNKRLLLVSVDMSWVSLGLLQAVTLSATHKKGAPRGRFFMGGGESDLR